MDRFSISQLEQFSGIKSHTIRIWETRYNALTPVRSPGNTRYYNNEQLRRLLNITSLLDEGYKISELAVMQDKDLFAIINSALNVQLPENVNENYFISQLIKAGMSFDEAYFHKVFEKGVIRLGLKNFYIRIIYPMLHRIGMMWSANSIPPAHEHFISNLVRQKISVAINSLKPVMHNNDAWLLFLPENEFHEIGLLFANYIVRSAGKKVIYLGSNVPLSSLIDAVKQTSPSNLLSFYVKQNTAEENDSYLNTLMKNFKKIKIYIATNERNLKTIKTSKAINLITSVKELNDAIK